MMKTDRKKLKRKYLETVQPMGIFLVRNIANGKILVDSGLNLKGKINGCKFQLIHGSHRNKALQEEFNRYGSGNFTFEIIDYLEPKKDEPKTDYADDLGMLEEMWLEKLQPFGEKGYNIFRSRE